MKYEVLNNCSNVSKRARKFHKKNKSRACRLASKKIIEIYLQTGDEDLTTKVVINPKCGWAD